MGRRLRPSRTASTPLRCAASPAYMPTVFLPFLALDPASSESASSASLLAATSQSALSGAPGDGMIPDDFPWLWTGTTTYVTPTAARWRGRFVSTPSAVAHPAQCSGGGPLHCPCLLPFYKVRSWPVHFDDVQLDDAVEPSAAAVRRFLAAAAGHLAASISPLLDGRRRCSDRDLNHVPYSFPRR